MHMKVKYEPETREMPWNVYATFENERVFKQGFLTEEEAREWANQQEKILEHPGENPDTPDPDPIEEASIESFPASDPPAWTKTMSGEAKKPKKQLRH